MKVQESFNKLKPTLYIVSTPIGNLKDITFRAIETLKSVDLVLCEDTRITSKLLNVYDIHKPLKSYQKFNERKMVDEVISILDNNQSLALVSDAGTPLVSDPGYILISELVQKNYNVVSVPGASASLGALVTSGLPTQLYTFIGFLPRKVGELKSLLRKYVDREETLIIYESPHRVIKSLGYLLEVLGNRRISIGRELTKKFETYYRGYLNDMIEEVLDSRGEYVLVIEGAIQVLPQKIDPKTLVLHYIDLGHSEKDAIKLASTDLGVHKSEVYKIYKIESKQQ